MEKFFSGKGIMRNKKLIIVIAISVLIGGFLFYKIIELNRSIDDLEMRLNQLNGQYTGQLQNAKYELEETLNKKDNFISKYSFEPMTRKIENGKLMFKVNIVPKTYTNGMNAELSIYGKDNYSYNMEYKDREYVAEIPLSVNENDIEFVAYFNDGEKVISQVLDLASDIVTEYVMDVNYNNNLDIEESNNKLIISGEVVVNYTPLYESDKSTEAVNYPVGGNVVVKRNRVNVLKKNIEFQDISNGQYFDCNDYVELDLSIEDYKESDNIEVFAKVVDNFGNVMEEQLDVF